MLFGLNGYIEHATCEMWAKPSVQLSLAAALS